MGELPVIIIRKFSLHRLVMWSIYLALSVIINVDVIWIANEICFLIGNGKGLDECGLKFFHSYGNDKRALILSIKICLSDKKIFYLRKVSKSYKFTDNSID